MALTPLLLFSVLLSTIYAGSLSNDPELAIDCSEKFKVRDQYYVLEKNVSIPGEPFYLTINWESGNIYFTYVDDLASRTTQIWIWEVKKGKNPRKLTNARIAAAARKGPLYGKVFIGTDERISLYTEDPPSIQNYALEDTDIAFIDPSTDDESLYFTSWRDRKIYNVKNGDEVKDVTKISNGKKVLFDDEKNIFFTTKSHEVSVVLKNDNKVVIIRGLENEYIVDITTDKNGLIYGISEHGNVYELHSNGSSDKLGTITLKPCGDIKTFAFDENENIIIGSRKQLFKFAKADNTIC